MSERYMKESDVYQAFYDFWEKKKSIADCLDMVPKYEIGLTRYDGGLPTTERIALKEMTGGKDLS